MSGFSDGVSKLWIVRIPRRSLDVEGFRDDTEAIEHLIRYALTWSENVDETKAKLRATFERALTHRDHEADPPDTGDPPASEEVDGDG